MTGLAEITRRIAHRHPFLLVDKVTEVVPGERLTAVKAVTASEPWFRTCLATDSDSPVTGTVAFPFTLLIESLCQAAGILAAWDAPRPSAPDGELMLLGALSDVTFHGSVAPGSVIRNDVRLVRDFGDLLTFSGTATVDGRTVLRIGEVLMAIRSR